MLGQTSCEGKRCTSIEKKFLVKLGWSVKHTHAILSGKVHCGPGILNVAIKTPCDVAAYHAAKVAAHKDVVERGQLQVGGPQVPGQLQALTVRHAAAPVRRTQRTCAGRAFI